MHGIKLEDRTTPAATTLEQIFDQVEQGELKNMSLVQFLSRDDAEADIFGEEHGRPQDKEGVRGMPEPETGRNSASACVSSGKRISSSEAEVSTESQLA